MKNNVGMENKKGNIVTYSKSDDFDSLKLPGGIKNHVGMEKEKGKVFTSSVGESSDDSDSFSDSDDESDGKLKSLNPGSIKKSDASTAEPYIPYKGLFDRERFMNNVLKKMVRMPISYEKPSDAPELALEYFKTVKKGGDYEYVDCVLSIPIQGGCHVNFFARLQGTESPPEFFFADVKNGCPREVVECCIIKSRPFSYGETPPPRLVVTHCSHVTCNECYSWADIEGNPDGTITTICA